MIRKLLCYFPALVKTAVFARQVRHNRAAAIFAGGKGSFAQSMMASALVAAGPGLVLLRNAHSGM
jgi:hypothetical protein